MYVSHVLSPLTGSAAPKVMPPPAPGMGLKGPPFGESFVLLKHNLCDSVRVCPFSIEILYVYLNVVNMSL